MKSPQVFFLAAIVALIGLTLDAATLSFQEGVSPSGAYTADSTTIRSDAANTPQDNDVDFENIVGRVGSGFMRNLYEFDLSEIDSQAAGRTVVVNSVSLNLTTRGAGQGTTFTADLHEYLFAFNESAATWNDPDGDGAAGTGDTTAGGTAGTLLTSLALDPTTANGGLFTFDDSAAFQTAVLDALASSDDTLRLLLKRNTETGSGNNFVRFYDEVFATTGQRPELVVDFSIVPEPASIALWLLLGLIGLSYGWRRFSSK